MSADRDELLDRVAVALHDAECPDRKCSGPALRAYYRQADIALGAARPAIAAQAAAAERERIRELAISENAIVFRAAPAPTFEAVPFADLLAPEATP